MNYLSIYFRVFLLFLTIQAIKFDNLVLTLQVKHPCVLISDKLTAPLAPIVLAL